MFSGQLSLHPNKRAKAGSEHRPVRRTRRRSRCRVENGEEVPALARHENEDQPKRHQRSRSREEKGQTARVSARQARRHEIRQILQIKTTFSLP